MRKYVAVLVFICVVLFLLPLPRCAAVEVKVGIYQNEPLIFTDETGTAKGIFADILEYIAFKEKWIHFAVPEGKNQNLLSTIDKHIVLLKNDEGSTYYLSLDKWFGVTSGRNSFPVWAKWFLISVVVIILLLFLGNIILRIKD